jgi:hypothetical protein
MDPPSARKNPCHRHHRFDLLGSYDISVLGHGSNISVVVGLTPTASMIPPLAECMLPNK